MTTTSTFTGSLQAGRRETNRQRLIGCCNLYIVWFAAVILAGSAGSPIFAADDVNLPSRLPGLLASFKTTEGVSAKRVDLMMQHAWSSPHQFDERLVESKPVDVLWQGMLEAKAEGRYQLHLYAVGKFTLTLNGQEIAAGQSAQGAWFASRLVDLSFGFHALRIKFQSLQSAGKLGMYWQGPGFELEPISERYLSHPSSETPEDDFQRGRLLTHALRCAACHRSSSLPVPMPGPELTRLAGNIDRDWLVSWLTSKGSPHQAEDEISDDRVKRRMPHFGLSEPDAADIVAALWESSLPPDTKPNKPIDRNATRSSDPKSAKNKEKNRDKKPERTEPDGDAGKIAFDTRGCVACHTLLERQIGEVDLDDDATYLPHNRFAQLSRELFDGGDLSAIALKRPADFFERWLAEPQKINVNHRMPLSELSDLERADIALYLATLTGPQSNRAGRVSAEAHSTGDARRGQTLLAAHRCAACHKLPEPIAPVSVDPTDLTADSHWEAGCLAEPIAGRRVPGFGLTSAQRRSIRTYWIGAQQSNTLATKDKTALRDLPADLLLLEKNCTACHARGADQGITARMMQIAADQPELAAKLPALNPPSLTGVGDKLHDHALLAAIERSEKSRRPWLEVRMPKYALEPAQRQRLIEHIIAQDRIPQRASHSIDLSDDVVTRAAAGRLLTSEGFGCQSCHQIGKQQPPTVALNARGTDLTMLGERIRQTWFDRWVRNPVRIVPRMEMPAIQLPVHGVLDDDLARQIDAVWEMLNTKDFQPPSPAPVRIVRGHNQPGKIEAAHVLTDVLETSTQNYLRPLIVGLGNRHNLLFDLEKAALAQWWIGDTARELTRGKSWYWEIGGQPLAQKLESLSKLTLKDDSGQIWRALPVEQFATELDRLRHTPTGVVWNGRITFGFESQRRVVPIEIALEPLTSTVELAKGVSGLTLILAASVPRDFALAFELDPLAGELRADAEERTWSAQLDQRSKILFSPIAGRAQADSDHRWQVQASAAGQQIRLNIQLQTEWTVDRFEDMTSNTASASPTVDGANAIGRAESIKLEPIQLGVVPGFNAVQLPLPRDEMPTALAWHQGELIVGSLKGRVCRALDRDGDGIPETWQPLSDDFPAPYGLASHRDGIDVLVKFGLIRLTEPDVASVPWSLQTVADGWGYTADYHDWAVGLPTDKDGNYFVALPCQQDDRSPSAARLRGSIQKLIPQSPTSENPRAYRLETFAAGQRFPMGLTFNREGALFATDNQGNYNPFNELNHLQSGKRYGFINKLEVRPDFSPGLESPAVNLPHPWTRSVNGICFLNTPSSAGNTSRFGPFEGHLIGCEYNGLSLIRMSLEVVDGVYQGAAYLFSRLPKSGEATFEGPVVCEVSPGGDLYVGNIHDSGWGGGQNTGSIVRLSPNGNWPLGIATVRAAKHGLSIQFTGKIDRTAASNTSNYTIRSYRRTSTPAYGGSDHDEREEKVVEAHVEPGDTRVELHLNELRADSVYEVRVGAVAGAGAEIFPAEAHYTMKRTPK